MQAPRATAQSQQERIEQLEQENRQLQRHVEQARFKSKRLQKRLKKVEQDLEKARRAIHRQAAPFSKGKPKAEPQKPGRKAGIDYGEPFSRPVPQRVDEVLSAPVSRRCPWGGTVKVERTEPQYQEDIVRRTLVRRFDIEVGHCSCCGARAQGRHRLQTSNALGSAKVQVGPEALVLGAHLNKQMGLSLGHTGRVLESGYGLEFSRGGIYKALARLASKAEPTYQGLLLTGRKSLVNWVDETGWRVGGRSQWLWVAESELVTVYSILPGRGSEQLKQILGADYNGWLVHDGLRCYSKLDKACHQTCLTHLIRRCKEMADRATQSAAQFPLQVKTLLQQALLLDDRYERQEMTSHGLAVATGLIEAAMDRLLDKDYRSASNKRMAKHLRQQREYLFTFLHCPGLGGTNNRAERAIRPAVIARKVWGGNRTWNGANVQQILMSVLRTFQQQGKDAFTSLVALLRFPGQKILEIVPTLA